MSGQPLIAGYRPQAALLLTAQGPLRQAQFLAQAAALAQTLPEAGHVLNLCESRHAFLLGFAAALLRGQISLLPPNRVPATVQAIRARYPDSYALNDADAGTGGFAVPLDLACADWSGAPPELPAVQIAALPFTSGSTGEPVPHAKSWGGLSSHAGLLSRRLGFDGAHVVATVPPQHTYGLETTVMMALAGGAVSHAARPFFPEDLAAVLQATPAPRLLVTTPLHLQALMRARPRLPTLGGVVCATAPLSGQLAAAAEDWLGAAVHEIYGSTESGAVATRRTSADAWWQPLPGMSLQEDADGALLSAPHLDGSIRLADLIETRADGGMLLLGRSGDLLKVAGKRVSLAELNHRLLAIPGVEDGVVFLPQPADAPAAAGLVRPAALVVAPGLSEQAILDALRQAIDPVFLPRPLRLVARLPRNELGKLPQAALLELLRA